MSCYIWVAYGTCSENGQTAIRNINLKLSGKILTKVKDLGVGSTKVVIKAKPWYFLGRTFRERKGVEQG